MEKIVEEAIKEIKKVRSYGTSGIVPRWEVIETVVQELERIKSLDINKLAEDWETGRLIHKDAIREKLDNYKEKIKLNEREIKKNPDPISSKITHSFDEYYQWKNKVTKENELLQAKIEALKELLKE